MNALCGFMEQGSSSQIPSLTELCFGLETWQALLGIFFARSQCNKSGPMKQVLKTLFSLWTRNPDTSIKTQVVQFGTQGSLEVIMSEEHSASGKPALQFLDKFLTKGAITASYVVSSPGVITQDGMAGRNAANVSQTHDTVPGMEARFPSENKLRGCVFNLLRWVEYDDTAAAAGRLLCALIKALLDEDVSGRDLVLPTCMDSIKQLVRWNSVTIQHLMHHVLPGLFRLNQKYTCDFLNSMPLLDLVQGDIGELSDSDLEICLLWVQVAEEMGLPISLSKLIIVDAREGPIQLTYLSLD